MVISSSLFAIEYNQYEMKRVYEFSVSYSGENDINDLIFVKNPGSGDIVVGPAIFFDGKTLAIADQIGGRTIYLKNDYSFNKIVKYSFYNKNIYKLDEYLLGFNKSSSISIYKSRTMEKCSHISFYELGFLQHSKSAFYHSNILFIHDKDGKLWSIKNPGLDSVKNRKNLLNEEKTLALFKDGDIDGLTIDSEKRLFLNGELQTLDYAVFYKYYKSLHPELEKLTMLEFQISPKTANMMTYINKDNHLNTYWDMGGRYICIFNSSGLLYDFFEYDSKKSSTTPAVSPSGDIYFMHHGEDKVTLYKIERQW